MNASTLRRTAERALEAARVLSTVSASARTAALEAVATALLANEALLLAANQRDLDEAVAKGMDAAMLDRLALNPARIAGMAAAVREVATQVDPVGEVAESSFRPNGLRVSRVRMPLGVIAVIYEARPNVTSDAAALAIRSGNAILLKGGSEAKHANLAIGEVVSEALAAAGLPTGAVQVLAPSDRAELVELLQFDDLIDLVIPRGGEGLIRFVAEHSRIPVIKHYTGVCFVYVDKAADLAMAENTLLNAKTQRPGVCNTAEQLLVHADIAPTALPRLASALIAKGVQLRVDSATALILAQAGVAHTPATPADYTAEFLDLILAVRIVASLDEAIATINRDSSGHTESIITDDAEAAARFQLAIDSAVVAWNASTRFNDGFEFGFGAEIGISTDRLHARGPMGLNELCSYKYILTGTGQVRA